MPKRLPPDLERVGDDLVAAAERSLAARRTRRRLVARTVSTCVAATVALTAFAPAALGPAVPSPSDVLLARASLIEPTRLPVACDQPGGRRVLLPVCSAGQPIRLGRPRRW